MECTDIFNNLELLVGRPITPAVEHISFCSTNANFPMGASQINEMLLSLDCQTMSASFFNEFFGGELRNEESMRKGVMCFAKVALLLYGNIQHGYKTMSRLDKSSLDDLLIPTRNIDPSIYLKRHAHFFPITEIDANKTCFNGYYIEGEIKARLEKDSTDISANNANKIMAEVHKNGLMNQESYLCSDHMDIYVATSMRKPHEYALVSQFCKSVFSSPSLRSLNVRWFDPTQAYCVSRIDKGLSEALMLKRAKCTIYLIQEDDTLGKSSELASTLAQGKTVIAYVPQVTVKNKDKWAAWIINYSKNNIFSDYGQDKIIYELTQTYCKSKKYDIYEKDSSIKWAKVQSIIALMANDIVEGAGKIWDSRASSLKNIHPLGIQVNLETGVSNGVIVCRDESQCVELIRRVLLNEMEYILDTDEYGGYQLKEKMTDSICRVSTSNPLLIRSFWNYYLKK